MAALRPRYPRLRPVGLDEVPAAIARPQRPRPAEGTDFTFRHIAGGRPVLWPLNGPIVVRAVGAGSAVLAQVTDELATLTGLPITLGNTAAAATTLHMPSEIRVLLASLTHPPADTVAPQPHDTVLGVGGASRDGRRAVLVEGFAVVDPARCAAAGVPLIGVVRHELAHAIGLHHANRTGCVLSRHRPVTEWADGDRAGLHRAGVGRTLSVTRQ